MAERKNVSAEKRAEYAKILSEMINCKTVFTENGENKAEFEKFYSVIEKNFPNITAKAEKLVFGSGCFFYVIKGENAKKNILLMSHHDVVDSGEGWETEAFSATEKDGFLYGREELSVAYHNKKFTDSLDNQQRSDNLIDKRRAVCRKQNKHDTECDSENTKDKRNRFIFRGHVAVISRCYGDHA